MTSKKFPPKKNSLFGNLTPKEKLTFNESNDYPDMAGNFDLSHGCVIGDIVADAVGEAVVDTVVEAGVDEAADNAELVAETTDAVADVAGFEDGVLDIGVDAAGAANR